jgi:hypothetical protein
MRRVMLWCIGSVLTYTTIFILTIRFFCVFCVLFSVGSESDFCRYVLLNVVLNFIFLNIFKKL